MSSFDEELATEGGAKQAGCATILLAVNDFVLSYMQLHMYITYHITEKSIL